MDMPENSVPMLELNLSRLLGWVRAAESRLALVLPLSTAMLGALAVLAPKFSDWSIVSAIFSSIAALLLLLSIGCASCASFPRTTGPLGSLIFFGGIVSRELDQYAKEIDGLTIEEYKNDLIRQCHRNAQIAERKYTWIKRSMAFLLLSAIPWAIALFTLYSAR